MPISMAVGTLDCTPTAPPWASLWMGGYGGAPRGNQGGVARRLRAQCAVIHDGVSAKVLLSVDVVGIPREIHQQIRSRVGQLGTASADFMLVASHTHSGPFIGSTSPDPYILMGLQPADIDAINVATRSYVDRLVDLVASSLALPRTPVTLGFAAGDVRIGYNRAELPTVLTEVPVLLARRTSNGKPFAVLFGYHCHAVARGNDAVFDSDYCGYAAETITAALGVPALFFQGAAGDQDPLDPHLSGQVSVLGQRVADTVVDVVRNASFTPVTGPITTRYTEVDLPLNADLGNPAAVIRLRNVFRARLDDNPPDSYAHRHAEVMLRKIAGEGLARSFPMPVQLWKASGLTVFGLAHEVLSRYHTRLRSTVGGKLWVMAYANEVSGYLAGDQTLQAGETMHFGYEAGWADDPTVAGERTWTTFYGWAVPLRTSPSSVTTPSGPSTEQIVVDACAALLNTAIV